MTPKEQAKREIKREIKRRVVTVEKAKRDFKRWIDEGLLRGGFPDDVIQYWIEVKKEVDNL